MRTRSGSHAVTTLLRVSTSSVCQVALTCTNADRARPRSEIDFAAFTQFVASGPRGQSALTPACPTDLTMSY